MRTAPWRRAPGLLLRRPGVLLSVAGAAMVLAVAVASVPLFLSSAGTEAVALQAGERCPKDTGATATAAPAVGSVLDAPDPFTPLQATLGPSRQWGRMETWLEGAESSSRTPVVVLYREGAEGHVEVQRREAPGGGVWLSDRAEALVGATPGRPVALGGVGLPVAGVYRDLAVGTLDDPYWCAHRGDLLLRGADLVPPRPVVLVDRATWKELERNADVTAVSAAWEAPLRPGVTVDAAQRLVDDLACVGERTPDLAWCASAPGAGADPAAFVDDTFESSLPFVVERAEAIQAAVGGGVWPVAALATLAGAGLVAATALLWCDRRRRELDLLVVRGVGPVALGVKAVLELGLAVVAGTVTGLALAYAVVVVAGPSPDIEPSAVARAGRLCAGAAACAAVLILAVVSLRTSARSDGSRPRRWSRVLPWELVLGAATLVSFRRLEAWGAPVSTGASVTRVDAVGLLFPVLFLATVVAVTSRLLVLVLGPVRASSRAWPAPLFLAVARVARYRSAVLGMVAASALAAGVLAYSATVQRSMDATLEAKSQVYLGGDVVVRIPQDAAVPAGLAGRATSVDLYQQAWVEAGRRTSVNLFAIDPATFADASWDPGLASTSLDEILRRLARPPESGRVPAVAVGVALPPVARAGIVTTGTTELELAEVGEVEAFPGMRRGRPAVFVAAAALEDLGLSTRVREIRIQGHRADIVDVLDRSGTGYQEVTTADHVVDAISFLTVSQTFGFLRSMALGSVLLVVGGVAAYLDARRRSRVLAYAFARRMGLSSAAHRRALSIEVLAGIGTGSWLGVAAALAAAALWSDASTRCPRSAPSPCSGRRSPCRPACCSPPRSSQSWPRCSPSGPPTGTIRWRCSVAAPDGAASDVAAPDVAAPDVAAPDVAARCVALDLDYHLPSGPVPALRDLHAAFPHGRLSVVTGPSGSGKSSLLRALAGRQRPTAGRVEVAGHDLTALRARRRRWVRRRRIGVVLQDPADNLVPYLGARGQIELAARLRGSDPAEAGALLEAVGLHDHHDRLPAELSGGEQQRVAFAAGAAGRPAVLLADEPTAELDGAAGAVLVEVMRTLVDGGATLVVASHDAAVVAAADLVVAVRDGRVAP